MDFQLIRNILWFILLAAVLIQIVVSLYRWYQEKNKLNLLNANQAQMKAARDAVIIQALRNITFYLAIVLLVRMILNVVERIGQ